MADNQLHLVKDFSSSRLTVRNWLTDLKVPERRMLLTQALESVLTPRVLAPLPPPLQLENRPGAIDIWIDGRSAESDVYLVTRTDDTQLLGLLILAVGGLADGIKDIHLGYLLAEHAWGQGVASELLQALVKNLPTGAPIRLIGGVAPDNPASARVLEKAGFQIDQDMSNPETTMFALAVA